MHVGQNNHFVIECLEELPAIVWVMIHCTQRCLSSPLRAEGHTNQPGHPNFPLPVASTQCIKLTCILCARTLPAGQTNDGSSRSRAVPRNNPLRRLAHRASFLPGQSWLRGFPRRCICPTSGCSKPRLSSSLLFSPLSRESS